MFSRPLPKHFRSRTIIPMKTATKAPPVSKPKSRQRPERRDNLEPVPGRTETTSGSALAVGPHWPGRTYFNEADRPSPPPSAGTLFRPPISHDDVEDDADDTDDAPVPQVCAPASGVT